MSRNCLRVATLLLAAALSASAATAADLSWEVVNPFRLYRQSKSFSLQESAFNAVRGSSPELPADIIQRIERCLNDPDPAHPEAFARCQGMAQAADFNRQRGWASSTLEDTCFDRSARPRRYPANCLRDGRSEDFVLPTSHSVRIGLSAGRRVEVGTGDCIWRWKRRSDGSVPAEPVRMACNQTVPIDDVPYTRDRASSGVEVEVRLPDGRRFSEDVVVDDLFVVALGDSFASGEGNPDKPVRFSNKRSMNYEPVRPETAAFLENRGRVRDGSYVLPKRLMRDEEIDKIYNYNTHEFLDAFWPRSAEWLSPDCHRSQYAFPFRVALQIALEDRHRAVTFATFGCSGAEVVNGLFRAMPAREHWNPSGQKTTEVRSQFEQLTNLICRTGGETTERSMKVFAPGSTQPTVQRVQLRSCPANQRKRDVDLVLLSIGGNDVGFSQIAAYTFLERVSDIAAVARVREHELRFGTNVGSAYLAVLDERLDAVAKALSVGFGVNREKVVHVSYEQALNDEQGNPCGRSEATALAGLDVHSRFRYDGTRVTEVVGFTTRLLDRMQCIAQPGQSCRGFRPAGGGTGFTLVVEHQPEFLRRGGCARGPEDANLMKMPRERGSSGFSPYLPGNYRPYASHQRLFRTPNDAFLTANEHKGGETPLIDILQPAIAALYSGAFHPTAEAHALVADHVMPHVRRVLAAGGVAADQPQAPNAVAPAQ